MCNHNYNGYNKEIDPENQIVSPSARLPEISLCISLLLFPTAGSKVLSGLVWSGLESQLAVENIQPVKLTPSLHDHRWSVPPPAAMLDPPDLILMVCDPNLTLLFHSSCLLSTQTDE